jgi:hypothetical protein
VLIARLTAQLRCYVPEPADETWARLRHLGVRREQLITEAGSQVQQMRDLASVPGLPRWTQRGRQGGQALQGAGRSNLSVAAWQRPRAPAGCWVLLEAPA